MRKCPNCEIKKYVTCHKEHHCAGPGFGRGSESYTCSKCGGKFDVEYEIRNGKTVDLRIYYKEESD